MKTIRPREHLITAGKMYPNAWKMADEFRADRGKDLPNWPDWCYLPLAGIYTIICADQGVNQLTPQLAADVSRLGALTIWRATQGVYRFDPAVYQSILDTPLTGDLPAEALYRLPEWCVYIETPNTTGPHGTQYGAWVHLEWDANTGRTELRILTDTEEDLAAYTLHIGPWSLTEALQKFSAEAAKQAGSKHLTLHPSQIDDIAKIVTPIISLALYLCSQNADFGNDQPHRPKPKKTKRGWRMFPPDKPRTWDVAVRIGNAIRQHYQQTESHQAQHSGPRPHIRRAHWHSFWTGTKTDTDTRKKIIKWIPPTPVNATSDELPTTVKPVK